MEKTKNQAVKNILTDNNKKLGVGFLQCNMPMVLSCRCNAPCKKECYCGKGNMRLIQSRHIARYEAYKEDPTLFFNRIDMELSLGVVPFMRWHSAGDIVDARYFLGMVDIAKKHPETKFLAFTKKYELVNSYLDKGGEIPTNLNVLFSYWGKGWEVPNPHNLPQAHIKMGDAEFDSIIPSDALHCGGLCAECVKSGDNCWQLGKGKAVVFVKH